MDKLAHYRDIIQTLLTPYGQRKPVHGTIDTELIFDTQRDHYQVIHVGWDQNESFVHGCVIHIDIKDDKIWIQWNSTEDDIAADLVNAGIPKEEIVIGFQSPFMRQFTPYAVG